MNRKTSYKTIVLSTVLALSTITLSTPIQALAEEQTSIKAEQQNKKSNLGTDNLKELIMENQKQAMQLDVYALELLQQPNFEFKYLQRNSLDKDPVIVALKDKLTQDLSNSKQHANTWLNEIKPQLIQTNENVVSYSTRFSKFHSPLYEAAKLNDTAKLKKGLTILSQDVAQQKMQVVELVKRLQKFQVDLETDASAFNTDTNQISVLLTAKGGINETNQKLLDSYNETIDKNNKIIIGTSFGILIGLGLAVGGTIMIILPEPSSKFGAGIAFTGAVTAITSSVFLGITVNNNKELTKQIVDITEKMTGNDLLMSDLNNVNKRTQSLSNTINTAIKNLQNTIDQWNSLESKYNCLIDAIDQTDNTDLTFVTVDLDTAKDEWNSIAKMSQGFYQ